MAGWRSRLRRLKDLAAPGARDDDMRREMAFHLDSLAEEHRESGLTDEAARTAARRRFGSELGIRDRGHDVRGAGRFDVVARELRHAVRRLLRSPGFAFASVATLSLALGAMVAVFTVVQRIVLNPLPYPASDRLVQLDHGAPRINVSSGIGLTAGLYHQYLDRARTLDAVAIYQVGGATLTGNGEPEQVRVVRATPTLSKVLQVQPAIGRWFGSEEGVPGAPPVVLVSHGLWMRRYGGQPTILGDTVTINAVPAEIIGVMPASFAFPNAGVDLWLPEPLTRASGFGLPFSHVGVARLGDGVPVATLRAELNGLIADLPRVFPGDIGVLGNVGQGGLQAAPLMLKDATVGQVAETLWLLLASVGLVLLIACANVANLFLVRAEARQREVAIRRALGVGRPGIARYFLAESVLLSTAGGVAGVGLAWAAVRLLVRFAPATLPRLEELRLDGVGLLFAAGLTSGATLAFAAIPWLRGVPLTALHESGRGQTASRGRHRARQLLMGGQVALALVLLVASGLVFRSFQKLRGVDIGFDPGPSLSFSIGLPVRGYSTRDSAVAAHQAILERLSAIGGVTGASAATALPLADTCFTNSLLVRGQVSRDRTSRPNAAMCAVAAGYFETLGAPVLSGRGIDRTDIDRHRPVVVVNRAFVDLAFPTRNAIGEHVRSNAPPRGSTRPDADGSLTWDGAPPWLEIVGIVSNTPTKALTEPRPLPTIYMPMSIAGGPDIPQIAMLGSNVLSMSYVVRSAALSLTLLPEIRRAVDAVDPNLALAQVQTLQDIVDGGAAQMAFTMVLLASAAAVALALGIVGIYGVVSYIVSQRAGEIGVRLALGAEPGSVVRMIVGQGIAVTLVGIGVGLAVALAASRYVASLLYQVSPRDPAVFAVLTLVLLGVALAACTAPAWRASRIDPAVVLRSE